MRFGLAIPDSITPQDLITLACDAEEADWDGLFFWDGGQVDPWVALAAAAPRTQRLLLGTMVTPLPRQQPWKVASEAATLDVISGGRVVLPVGLGVLEFEKMGIPKDYRIRAAMLDEGLEIIARLWSGEPFGFQGRHYALEEGVVGPVPAQRPRPPIWVVGGPARTQLRRAARWDGAMIQGTPEEIGARREAIENLRGPGRPLEIITEQESPGDDPQRAAALVAPYAAVGVTWWNEAVWHRPYEQGGVEGMRRRIKQGPPRPR